jgi:hypothetical protein
MRERIAARLGSPFFMAVPNRNFLVCWSRDFGKAAEFAKQVTRDFGSRPHPLSPEVFETRGIRRQR